MTRLHAQANRHRRGSILVLTLAIGLGLCIMIGVLLRASVLQAVDNKRSILTIEAKNAVESAAEYAISQIRLRFDNYPGITGNYFISNPITIPSNISSWVWNGTDVGTGNVVLTVGAVPNMTVIYIDPSNPANAFDPDRGKNVAAADVYVYAKATALVPNFATTTAYGEEAIEVRNNPLFTNAIFYNMDLEFHPGPAMSITGPVHCNGNIWAVAQTGVTFSGPVTSSGNFNVGMIPWPTSWGNSSESSQTGATVYIPNNAGGYTTPYIGTGSQQLSSSYYDSRQTSFGNSTYNNWRTMSANLWGGNLQTSANGVPDEQVTGYNDFVYKVGGTSQDLNYAYAIIEPAQNTTYANGTTNPFNLGSGENEKFERQASVIVKVVAMGTTNITVQTTVPGNVTGNSTSNNTIINSTVATNELSINTTVAGLYSSGNLGATNVTNSSMILAGNYIDSTGTVQTIAGNLANPVYSAHPNAVLLVTQTQNFSNATMGTNGSQPLMEAATSKSYSSSGNKTTISNTRYVGFAWVEFNTLQSTVNGTTNTLTPTYNGSTAQTDAYGDVTYPGDVIMQPLVVNSTMITGTYNPANGSVTNGALQNLIQFSPGIGNMSANSSYTGNTSDVWGGMYDQRRNMLVSTLNLDVGKLKNIVDNNAAGYSANSGAFFNGSGNTDFDPASQYNGVVYVEFPELPGNASRLNSVTANGTTYPGDAVLDSVDGTGLVLFNGTSNSTSTGVPNPNYANTTLGQIGRVNGFTVATNNCVYIQGNYNADGNMSTPLADNSTNLNYDSTMPDVPSNPDPACCIAGDSVTALSGNWVPRHSGQSYSSNLIATPTEVNTAILGGIVPSEKYSATEESGGSHNFPRFLENWGGVVFRYRGSMVCLYESEIANQTWSTNYYSPPNREWGFYNQFAKGIYPPGTPSSRSYYRVNFSYISGAAYTAATGLPQ
jgi:hypothetical protein